MAVLPTNRMEEPPRGVSPTCRSAEARHMGTTVDARTYGVTGGTSRPKL